MLVNLLELCSYKEKVLREKKLKNLVQDVEMVFLNVDQIVELCFSWVCTFEDLLTNFFRERKERRGEKWDLDDRKVKRERGVNIAVVVVKKRFEIEMIVWKQKTNL